MSVRRTRERWSAQHSHPPGRALHPETHGAAHAHPLGSRFRKRVGGPGKCRKRHSSVVSRTDAASLRGRLRDRL